MGAILIIVAALFVANSIGRLFERWLSGQDLEPPLRPLLLRLLRDLLHLHKHASVAPFR
jgi:hypothetical protein